MAEFSYENDIAPLQGNYFADRLNTQEAVGLQNIYNEAAAPIAEDVMKLGAAADRRKLSAMAFERQSFMLQEAKDKARRDREYESLLPEVSAKLSEALSDPTADPFTAMERVSQLQMQYPRAAAGNETIRGLFSAATGNLNAKFKRMDYFERKKDSHLRRVQAWADRGEPDIAKAIALETDGIDPSEANSITTAGVVQKRAAEEAATKRDAAARQGLGEAQRKSLERRIDSAFDVLNSLKDESGNDALDLSVLAGDTPAAKPPEFNLDKQSRRKLTLLVSRLSKHKVADLKDYPNEKLFDVASELLAREQSKFDVLQGVAPPRAATKPVRAWNQ